MLESKTTEFKREFTDDIKYAVTAFANTDCGKIYIGLNDDGSAYGVTDVDRAMLRVADIVRDTVCPDVMMFLDCAAAEAILIFNKRTESRFLKFILHGCTKRIQDKGHNFNWCNAAGNPPKRKASHATHPIFGTSSGKQWKRWKVSGF